MGIAAQIRAARGSTGEVKRIDVSKGVSSIIRGDETVKERVIKDNTRTRTSTTSFLPKASKEGGEGPTVDGTTRVGPTLEAQSKLDVSTQTRDQKVEPSSLPISRGPTSISLSLKNTLDRSRPGPTIESTRTPQEIKTEKDNRGFVNKVIDSYSRLIGKGIEGSVALESSRRDIRKKADVKASKIARKAGKVLFTEEFIEGRLSEKQKENPIFAATFGFLSGFYKEIEQKPVTSAETVATGAALGPVIGTTTKLPGFGKAGIAVASDLLLAGSVGFTGAKILTGKGDTFEKSKEIGAFTTELALFGVGVGVGANIKNIKINEPTIKIKSKQIKPFQYSKIKAVDFFRSNFSPKNQKFTVVDLKPSKQPDISIVFKPKTNPFKKTKTIQTTLESFSTSDFFKNRNLIIKEQIIKPEIIFADDINFLRLTRPSKIIFEKQPNPKIISDEKIKFLRTPIKKSDEFTFLADEVFGIKTRKTTQTKLFDDTEKIISTVGFEPIKVKVKNNVVGIKRDNNLFTEVLPGEKLLTVSDSSVSFSKKLQLSRYNIETRTTQKTLADFGVDVINRRIKPFKLQETKPIDRVGPTRAAQEKLTDQKAVTVKINEQTTKTSNVFTGQRILEPKITVDYDIPQFTTTQQTKIRTISTEKQNLPTKITTFIKLPQVNQPKTIIGPTIRSKELSSVFNKPTVLNKTVTPTKIIVKPIIKTETPPKSDTFPIIKPVSKTGTVPIIKTDTPPKSDVIPIVVPDIRIIEPRLDRPKEPKKPSKPNFNIIFRGRGVKKIDQTPKIPKIPIFFDPPPQKTKKKRKIFKVGDKSIFTPSLVALSTGLKGKKLRRVTGLEIRPITF